MARRHRLVYGGVASGDLTLALAVALVLAVALSFLLTLTRPLNLGSEHWATATARIFGCLVQIEL